MRLGIMYVRKIHNKFMYFNKKIWIGRLVLNTIASANVWLNTFNKKETFKNE